MRPLLPSDVIVGLAGCNRMLYAESLVERGLAPRMLSTRVDPGCVRTGQPPQACASGVRSTVDEALFMRRILTAEGIRRATVVTSRYHVSRAAIIFWIVFIGSGVEVSVVAPPGRPPGGNIHLPELQKLFPTVGAAVIGRLSPSLYRWINEQIYEEWKLRGYPHD